MDNEFLLNYLDVKEKSGRRYCAAHDNRWGELILPAPSDNPQKTKSGLKVALFASWKFGYIVLETLKKFENRFPERLNLVGLVTDNPLNPDARISRKKRIWHLLELPYQVVDESIIIESGLCHGMPVYNGEIKIDSFHRLLKKWKPDVILVCVFGQIIDKFTIDYPGSGIYNFHPSDLAGHHGAGPAPAQDLIERNADTDVWTIHHVSEELDAGHIVGQSPPVKIRDENGKVPENDKVIYDKLAWALSPLTYYLAETLCIRFESGIPGPANTINFNKLFSNEIKDKLMQPVINADEDDLLPEPDSPVFLSF